MGEGVRHHIHKVREPSRIPYEGIRDLNGTNIRTTLPLLLSLLVLFKPVHGVECEEVPLSRDVDIPD